ncbi:hypothetical protein MMC13_006769 [Lambiella insularis]|nr:hypothetical protein [Lambiella insularis]
MTILSTNPWETTSKSELVSIGTHKLFLSTSGPPRKLGAPVVIYFTGGGAPVAMHVRLQSLLSDHARVYFYDRAGYDRSERGPIAHPTAQDTAAELESLLLAVQVPGPYILVGHSFGGIAARSFFDLQSDAVAGMVLADTGTEMMYALFDKIPSADLEAVGEAVDWISLTNLKEDSKLSDDQWQAMFEATERTVPGSKAEDIRGGVKKLAYKRQLHYQALGERPLSVMRCNWGAQNRVLYDAGVKMGGGTEEQREGAKRYMEKVDLFHDELIYAQMRLSRGKARYVYLPGCWHDIVLRQPEPIVTEVRWVLEQLKSKDAG